MRGRDGELIWHYKTGAKHLSPPIASESMVWVGASDGCVYALRVADGALLWKTFVSDKLYGVAGIRVVSSSITQQPSE